eukprot:2383292-Prymnesium_polylepis.1
MTAMRGGKTIATRPESVFCILRGWSRGGVPPIKWDDDDAPIPPTLLRKNCTSCSSAIAFASREP